MVGIFSVIPESSNMDLEYFAQNNAPALMFPYIREIIATTTLKAGLPSVLLPPLNIHAIINHKEPS
jgi:preprotein translocase subunit SecB